MTNKEKAEIVFKEEFELITDATMKSNVLRVFEEIVPDYFFEKPASLSGKYHPAVSSGTHGLIRHTKLVCYAAEQLMSAYAIINENERNMILAACILHDGMKFGLDGKGGKNITSTHGLMLAAAIKNAEITLPEQVIEAIAGHMGIWSCSEAFQYVFLNSESVISTIVHLADYTASRKFETVYEKLDNIDFDFLLDTKNLDETDFADIEQ